jgi:hypothetical protein
MESFEQSYAIAFHRSRSGADDSAEQCSHKDPSHTGRRGSSAAVQSLLLQGPSAAALTHDFESSQVEGDEDGIYGLLLEVLTQLDSTQLPASDFSGYFSADLLDPNATSYMAIKGSHLFLIVII